MPWLKIDCGVGLAGIAKVAALQDLVGKHQIERSKTTLGNGGAAMFSDSGPEDGHVAYITPALADSLGKFLKGAVPCDPPKQNGSLALSVGDSDAWNLVKPF